MNSKKWYLSKTLWTNIIAFAVFFAQVQFGKEVIPSEIQASLLAVINLILRIATKEELDWGGKE